MLLGLCPSGSFLINPLTDTKQDSTSCELARSTTVMLLWSAAHLCASTTAQTLHWAGQQTMFSTPCMS